MIRYHRNIPVVLLLFCLAILTPMSAQQDAENDQTMDKLKKLLEKKDASGDETSSSGNSDDQNDELEALKEANRELHGGDSPESREKKNPSKILDDIIEKMDTAARSLETNVRKINVLKQKLKQLQLNREQNGEPTRKQKQILKQIESILDDSKDSQKTASKQLQELLSFKKQLSQVQSAQKQSLSSIDQLLKIARKQSSSSSSSSGQKRRQQQKKSSQKRQKQQSQGKRQQQANQPQNQRQNKNQPANEPYEASSTPPDQIKIHSKGGASSWGELPEKVREAIIQRRNEDFVPRYGERLRQYYKKLGEDSARQ